MLFIEVKLLTPLFRFFRNLTPSSSPTSPVFVDSNFAVVLVFAVHTMAAFTVKYSHVVKNRDGFSENIGRYCELGSPQDGWVGG